MNSIFHLLLSRLLFYSRPFTITCSFFSLSIWCCELAARDIGGWLLVRIIELNVDQTWYLVRPIVQKKTNSFLHPAKDFDISSANLLWTYSDMTHHVEWYKGSFEGRDNALSHQSEGWSVFCCRLCCGQSELRPHYWMPVCGKINYDFTPLWFICSQYFLQRRMLSGKVRVHCWRRTRIAFRSSYAKHRRYHWAYGTTDKV